MVRHICVVASVVAAVVCGACGSQPTGPVANTTILRDTDDPECADTVYEPARTSARSAATGGNDLLDQRTSTSGCHVVIIYY
jgi:hypothetical protein